MSVSTKPSFAGIRAAYDGILADGLKRRHPVQQIIGTLLKAEIAARRHAPTNTRWRPPGCRRSAALTDFDFTASPGNEPLIQELATDGFLEGQRNIVLAGGTSWLS